MPAKGWGILTFFVFVVLFRAYAIKYTSLLVPHYPSVALVNQGRVVG